MPEILRAYGVTLVTSDGGPPPACGTATTGSLTSQGTAVEPKSGYYEAVAGAHEACLTGPANTDFDLYLQKWNGSSWRTVASGTGPTSTEKVTYTGTSGRCRWQLRSYSGSGQYTLESTKPQGRSSSRVRNGGTVAEPPGCLREWGSGPWSWRCGTFVR